MERKAQKNPAYRTREELIKDVTIVLNTPGLSYGTKHMVCKQAASEWTEHDGKYRGCPYWSTRAVEQWQATKITKGLRHEHAVPKKIVVDVLLKMENPKEEDVELLFRNLLIAVVVTAEEDRALNAKYKCSVPEGFYESLNWQLRYAECGIEVQKVTWK